MSLNNKMLKILNEAIEGEQQAVNKYKKYADIANKEGFPKVALLFQALVESEKVHIKNHQNAIKAANSTESIDFPKPTKPSKQNEISPSITVYDREGSTVENLADAEKSEMYEYRTMYPNFIKTIKKEKKSTNRQVAELSLKWAREVELTHAKALKYALNQIKKGHDLHIASLWVCRVCGNLVLSNRMEPPKDLCPICGHDAHFYQQITEEQEGGIINE